MILYISVSVAYLTCKHPLHFLFNLSVCENVFSSLLSINVVTEMQYCKHERTSSKIDKSHVFGICIFLTRQMPFEMNCKYFESQHPHFPMNIFYMISVDHHLTPQISDSINLWLICNMKNLYLCVVMDAN